MECDDTGAPGSEAKSTVVLARARRPGVRPSTNVLGGLWYTDASDAMWQMSSSWME